MFTGGFENIRLRPNRLLAGLIVLLLLLGISCYMSFVGILDYARDPERYAMQQAERMMQAAQTAPSDTFSSPLRTFDEGCWQFLHESLVENGNQYTLTGRSLAADYPDDPLYADGIEIVVAFPDGRQAALVWYRRGLRECLYQDERE